MYATVADLLADAPPDLVAHLTGTAEPDSDSISRALENASGEIDAYLASRYTVPLTSAPIMLRRMAVNIALYELMKLRPLGDIEDSRRRYEDAIRFLELVNQGKVSIGPAVPPESTQPTTSGGPAFVSPPSIMKGMDY